MSFPRCVPFVLDATLPHQIKEHQPTVCLVVQRNKNKNVVIYEANVKDGKLCDPPIVAYWLDLDPEYQKANRSKGKQTDRDEFSFLDHQVAWGFECRKVPKPNDPKGERNAIFWLKNAPEHKIEVFLNGQNKALTVCTHKGKRYAIESLFIDSTENVLLGKANLKRIEAIVVEGNGRKTITFYP